MSPPKNRSVLDYDNEQSLRAALMMPPREHAHLPEGRTDSERKETNSLSNLQSSVESEKLDWVLPAYNPETTEAQSMKEELRRLLVLKSYLILDAEREIAFDRITGMASRMFDVPICLVSLVDLGRQWFMSNRGLGETRETPRRHAFCAHAILSKSDIFVVPDATKDFRFKDNPLVTSSPNIRFYAGTPLVSPEGYKLGTFCIIDKKPWPDGLSNSQKAILKDLSDTVVHEMKNRRERLMNDGPTSQLIATTAHDLLTPLSGVQLSLTLLKEDEQVQSRLGPQQIELLNTASNCSDVMIRICRSTMESFRDETTNDSASVSTGVSSTLTQLAELKKSLLLILDPTPKRVPLIITIAKDVPATIVCDDLKLFRSALNLLTTALARTKYGKVHLTVRVGTESGWDDGKKELYFECQDTANDIKSETSKLLFQPSRPHDGELRMALSSVALLITSLDGRYGFKPFKRKDSPPSECGGGSVFWFCVPLIEATEEMIAKSASLGQISVLRSSESLTAMAPSLARQFRMRSAPNIAAVLGRSASSSAILGARVNSAGLPFEVFTSHNMRNSSFDMTSRSPKLAAPAVTSAFASILNSRRNSTLDRKEPPSQVVLKEPPTTRSEKRSARERKALIIEDSTVVRKTLARALTKLGFTVTQSVDGSEGLKALKNDLFDLTLCDFLMPVMDGMDCVKQYRDWEATNRPNLRLLIVGISAHANANDSDQGIKVGMDRFWPKPVTIKKLTEFQQNPLTTERCKALDKLWEVENGPSCNEKDGDGCTGQPPGAKTSLEPQNNLTMDLDDHKIGAKRPGQSFHDETSRKRQNIRVEEFNENQTGSCLIVTRLSTPPTEGIASRLESQNWEVVTASDGIDALNLLQMRNYNVVLIDDCIPRKDAYTVMAEFRQWEEENRVNRQSNTFMVCDADLPSPTGDSTIQPPTFFDGVLSKPVVWKDLEFLLKKHKARGMEIVQR